MTDTTRPHQSRLVCSGRQRNGFALVDGDLLEHAIQISTSPEKSSGVCMVSLRTKQKVNGVAVAVGRPLYVSPLAGDLNVGLVYRSARADRLRSPPEHRSQHSVFLVLGKMADLKCAGTALHGQTVTPGSAIEDLERIVNRLKSKVRSRVEYVFAVVKRLWGFNKVRYWGVFKNAPRALVVTVLANIHLARRHFLG